MRDWWLYEAFNIGNIGNIENSIRNLPHLDFNNNTDIELCGASLRALL